VEERKGKGSLRLDRISDGKKACGFAWTWTCDNLEGLRGTTFVEFHENGEIGKTRHCLLVMFLFLSASVYCILALSSLSNTSHC